MDSLKLLRVTLAASLFKAESVWPPRAGELYGMDTHTHTHCYPQCN